MNTETNSSAQVVLPEILDENKMTPGMARYWKAQQVKLAGRVSVIDPWRTPLRELRSRAELLGKKVYRASTGGRYGKSAQITVI